MKVIGLLLLALPALGQITDLGRASYPREETVFDISQATLGAAVLADLGTSRNGREATALYRSPEGRCEEKCAAIRLGIYGGTMLLQRLALRKTRNRHVRRLFIGMNIFGTAAGFNVAANNKGVK